MYEVKYAPQPVTYRLRPKRNYLRICKVIVETSSPKTSSGYTEVAEFDTDNNQLTSHFSLDQETHKFLYDECVKLANNAEPAPVNRKMPVAEINAAVIKYLKGFNTPVDSSLIVQELAHSELSASNKIRTALTYLRKIEKITFTGTGWKVLSCTN